MPKSKPAEKSQLVESKDNLSPGGRSEQKCIAAMVDLYRSDVWKKFIKNLPEGIHLKIFSTGILDPALLPLFSVGMKDILGNMPEPLVRWMATTTTSVTPITEEKKKVTIKPAFFTTEELSNLNLVNKEYHKLFKDILYDKKPEYLHDKDKEVRVLIAGCNDYLGRLGFYYGEHKKQALLALASHVFKKDMSKIENFLIRRLLQHSYDLYPEYCKKKFTEGETKETKMPVEKKLDTLAANSNFQIAGLQLQIQLGKNHEEAMNLAHIMAAAYPNAHAAVVGYPIPCAPGIRGIDIGYSLSLNLHAVINDIIPVMRHLEPMPKVKTLLDKKPEPDRSMYKGLMPGEPMSIGPSLFPPDIRPPISHEIRPSIEPPIFRSRGK